MRLRGRCRRCRFKDEAIQLFIDRARHVRPDFAVPSENTATLEQICKLDDEMPLAIELAAARIRALSLSEIVDSLHDRFRLLTGGARTAVRRQQTLRASVDWSHALLSKAEQVLFRRLAVFLGGFDLDAAQAVAGGDDVERYQALDMLTLLVDKSLVVAWESRSDALPVCSETMRQYALEKLGESREADHIRTRHRDHFVAAAAQMDDTGRSDKEYLLDQLGSRYRQSARRGRVVPARAVRSRTPCDWVVAAAAVADTWPRPRGACLVECCPHGGKRRG